MARRPGITRKKKRMAPAAGEGTLIGLRLEPGLLAPSIAGRRRRRTLHRGSKPSAALSSWGLRQACGQECVPRKLEKRQKWQVRKSTAWATRRQPTKNGNSASGGLSRDRKSSGIFAAIAGQTRNPTRLRYDKAALR